MEPILVIIGGLILVNVLSRGVPSYAEIITQDVRFKVTSINIAGYSGTIYIDIANASRSVIPLDRGNGELYYGGNVVGQFLLKNPVKLQPGKVTTVEVIGTIPAIGFGMAVIDAIKTGNYLKDLTFKGRLIYGAVVVPVNRVIYKAK